MNDNEPPSDDGTDSDGHRTNSDDNGKRRRRRRRRRPKSAQKTSVSDDSTTNDGGMPLPLPELRVMPEVSGKTRFTDLDIAPEALAGIQDLGFEYCSPIQQQCLPDALAGSDITGKAQTGTGKTAAFLTATFSRLVRNPKSDRKAGTCRALVLAPTRELAIQIHKDAEALGKYCGCNNLVVYGGMGYDEQRAALAQPVDILVATPGRLLDYARGGYLSLRDTEILVIDEADRMLDMGFIPDVRRIERQLPPAGKRHTMFFSATLSAEILRLVDRWLVTPVMLESEPEQLITDLIDQQFYSLVRDEKLPFLLWLLRQEDATRVIVFANRKDTTSRLADNLRRYGVESGLLSGDIPQRQRLKILERFRSGTIQVVVATDVAARGIHVDGISHVINYDLPYEPEDYVHRIGRTGRAGIAGKSISFVCEYGAYIMPDLEKYLDREFTCHLPEADMVTMPEPVDGAERLAEPTRRQPTSGRSRQRRRPSSGRRPKNR